VKDNVIYLIFLHFSILTILWTSELGTLLGYISVKNRTVHLFWQPSRL